MPRSTHTRSNHQDAAGRFTGFALPTSNTTYTPNQFFDVCLPHYSRGVVRLVGYMIRKTLGWCDAHGNPQSEQHFVSWSELEHAGISREMIRPAIAEAIAAGFIRCVQPPRMQKAGQPAVSGLYELRWDQGEVYVKNPAEFQGFFAGEGNRTYIPNQFFDHVLPKEPLAVVKVVGAVIRFSIGFQNKWGHRRQNVSLSYQHIQNYSRLHDRKTLSAAVGHALETNYIERVEAGYFDPDAGRLSRAAVYAVKWLSGNTDAANGQKTPPGIGPLKTRSKNPTGHGQKTLPDERSENPTDIEIKQTNKTSKQQPKAPVAVGTFERLKAEGFDARSAEAITSKFSVERIERQLRWIDRRRVKANRLGMLRAAIEQNWAEPATAKRPIGDLRQRKSDEADRGRSFAEALAVAKRRFG